MANEREVTVVVHVRVNEGDPQQVAVEMVKDALADRAARWHSTTFVSEGDVHVLPPNLAVPTPLRNGC